MAEDIQKFISVAFKRCLSRQKSKDLAREYPKPQVAKAPETDPVLADFLGKRYPEQQDQQLSRIQTSILAACAPLTDLWSKLCDQGLSGEEDELIPVEEVLKIIRASLALIWNSSNYVSQLRRKTIIEALPADKANLAKIMKQVCRGQIENSGSELFGDQAIKAVSGRVNTLETFSKTASKSEVKLRQQPKGFFSRGPTRQVRGRCGHNRSTVHSTQRQFRQSQQQVSTSSFQPQVLNQCTFQERGKLSAAQKATYPVKPALLGSTQPVGGRLRYHLTYWRGISDSNWIVQTAGGYRLELIRHPPSTPPPQQPRLSAEQQEILELEVRNLLQKRAIEECHDQGGFYSSLFIVPKKDGGWRTIINLKNLNRYLRVQHFKMESIYSVRDVLHRGNWMTKLDLQDTYLTVPIFHSYRRFLRFQWKAQAYQFRCLPFGLATVPRVFTKLMRPVVTCLRQQGIRLVQYLDDTLLLSAVKDWFLFVYARRSHTIDVQIEY